MNANAITGIDACNDLTHVSSPIEAAELKSASRRDETHQSPQTHQAIRFAIIRNHEGFATKTFAVDTGGRLIRTAAAHIFDGSVRVVEALNLQEVLAIVESLAPNEALTFGVPAAPVARIVTRKELIRANANGAIARDREHFAFDHGPAILMIDCDPRPGYPPLHWREIDVILSEVVPGWGRVARIWRPSASSFIFTSKGEELIGPGGWRAYAVVDNGSAIPDVGACIFQTLWERGHGYIVVSKAGLALHRTLVDGSVWQPERLDFAAEPQLGPGIERHAPPSELIPGEAMLATAKLRPKMTMSDWRKTSAEAISARASAQTELTKARRAHVRTTTDAYRSRGTKLSDEMLHNLLARAVEHRCLAGPFELQSSDGRRVTVAEVLAHWEAWDGERFADPLEPDYRNDHRIAYACLGISGDPLLYSHAHGGTCYKLASDTVEISLERGHQPRTTDQAIDLLRAQGQIFERGGELVRISGRNIIPITDEWISDHLARNAHFSRPISTSKGIKREPVDPPMWLARRIIAKSGELGLPQLRSLVTAPTMRLDGTLLQTAGYDEATGLLLLPGSWPEIPRHPSPKELYAACTTIYTPFAEFPFVDAVSRGVMLAAVLTAAIRQILPLAPAFLFDAPAAGSGKTLLAKCLAALCGMDPTVIPETRSEQEFTKRLLAALRSGRPVLLFDNIRGEFRSPSLEAMLTAATYGDRVLGASVILELPTTALVLISGNNFRAAGDLWRRVLTVRIDAKVDAPERRSFAFDPLAHCQENRQAINAAALTILRGFMATGSPRSTRDLLASFESWDALVRQAVLWVQQSQLMPSGFDLADPVESIEKAKSAEPGRQQLEALLSAAFQVMENRPWRVADIIKNAAQALPEADSPGPLEILAEVLDDIAGDAGSINPRKLGRWLERHGDQRCNGLWLARAGRRAHAVLWQVLTDKPSE